MTDEEIAEKYAKSIVIFDRDFHNDRFAEIEQAFLAGLKAGRPKWHKVADGDFPKEKGAVLSDKGEFVYYNSFSKCLVDETYSEQTDVIAWREIPKYTEEIDYV